MEPETILDITQSIDDSPLESWKLIHRLRSVLEKEDLDVASCTRIARSILPTLGLLRNPQELDDEELDDVLLAMQYFIAHHMDSVNSNEGPGIIFDCLEELHKLSPKTSRFIDLVSELQNTLVDHFVRSPDPQPPSQNRKIANCWFNGVLYAMDLSKFDVTSPQVTTLCRSIGDAFFGGAKLSSALKKLADITVGTDKSRTDFPYLFDFETVALVKRYSSEHGAFVGYSFLWAVFEAFLLRVKNEPDYLSILKLVVHLLQALGVPIKCMATPSLLEYPQSELSETERLFHLVKILEIYVASNLHHPSVLVKAEKRFNGKLIFEDIMTYILKHDAKGTICWYNALLHLGAISPSIITAKLRMILQNAWFNCDVEDVQAQDALILYLIDLYDKMNRSTDFYNKFPGAINDYLEKPKSEPRLSNEVLRGMRRSFARLGSDDVVTIWTNYIRYFQQVIAKWKENPDEVNDMPQLFALKIFTEFIQHCPLVPMVQLTQEQHEKMDSAISSTLTLTEILQEVIETLPEKTKTIHSYFFKISQNFIKTCFARRCYLQNSFHHAFEEASIRQRDLVERFDSSHKSHLKKNKRLKLDLTCYSAKFSENPREEAKRCLLSVCENFNSLNWPVFLMNNTHVVKSASKKQIEVFIGLVYESMRDLDEDAKSGHLLYLRSQVFRDCPRQVLSFVRHVAQDLTAELVKFDPAFVDVIDADGPASSVKWTELRDLLQRLEPENHSYSAILKANEMLSFVPVHSLPAPHRLMFLALFISFAVTENKPSEEFFAACFRNLADWSSALKSKEDIDIGGGQISVSVYRLANLCLERVLSIDPQLGMSRAFVKEIIDLIRFNLYVAAKTAESEEPFESIIAQAPPKNEAQLCAILCLVETVTRVHSRNISQENVSKIKSTCQTLVNKRLKKMASKLENPIFIINKYAEVFGVDEASKLERYQGALESATESVRLAKPETTVFQLFLKAANFDDVINCFFLLRAVLVVGKEFLDEFNRQLNNHLAEKLWPLLEETWDSMGAPRSAALFDLSWGDEVDPPAGPVPSRDILCERFLEVTLASIKHLNKPDLVKLVVQIHRLIAVQTLYHSFRVDLCCLIMDAAARKHATPEIVHTVQAAFGSIPWDRLGNLPVDQWCTIMCLCAEIYCRAFAFKPNYTNGTAPILLAATGKLIEGVVKRGGGHSGKDNLSEVAEIIKAIDSVNRLLVVLNRHKTKDHTRSIETVGPFLVAAYLRSVVGCSVHETFRQDLRAMAVLALGLCNPKSLLTLKLERPKAEQEVLRRLVEDCKARFQ